MYVSTHMMCVIVVIFVAAAVVIGFRAIKFLTKGARVLESNQHFRLFKKPGGYRQALKDFRSVKPREVHRIFGKSFMFCYLLNENIQVNKLHLFSAI